MLRLTPVVRNLIFINVAVFILQMVFARYNVTERLALWDMDSEFFRPYQLFTYMFAHGGISHIFFNMLGLAFIGPILENYWGAGKFTLFYMITGIGAGVFNIIAHSFFKVDALTVGASGALYGILMGFGMLFPNMEVRLLIPPIPIKAKYLVVVLGGLAFIMDSSGQVAHFAHLGGAVVAFILVKLWHR